MQLSKISLKVGLSIALLTPLMGCSSDAVQQALSADPKVEKWGSAPQLPQNFPNDLEYPNATLQVIQEDSPSKSSQPKTQLPTKRTRWTTTDRHQIVQRYYSKLLQKGNWQLTHRESSRQQLILMAKRGNQNVRVVIPADAPTHTQSPSSPSDSQKPITMFLIDYSQSNVEQVTKSTPSSIPQTGDLDFVGPIDPRDSDSSQLATNKDRTNNSSDQVSSDLKTYVRDLQQLKILDIDDPNQPIQRGTFARWLVEINNKLYQDRPTLKIRLAATNQKPAFTDVPQSDPNFPYIQGLAEAGFIPSPLSGDVDQTVFEPTKILTREILLSWKVPIDFRKILPSTTAKKVQETWGFKDNKRISKQSLSAIFADHDNGELANIHRLLGSALLFQPQRPVTQEEAAATLWFIGVAGEGYSAKDILRAERQNLDSQ